MPEPEAARWANDRSSSLNRTANDLKHIVDRDGIAVIENIDPCENSILRFAHSLGSPDLTVPQQLCGPRVMHLRYDAIKAADTKHEAYFTAGAFPLHTDLSYADKPPKYLLMMCVCPDPDGGGVSTVSDIRSAWASISERDRVALSEPEFSFENAPNTGAGRSADQPIYEKRDGADVWRFRQDTLRYPRSKAPAIRRLANALAKRQQEIALVRGSLLILDNHRFAHGRTGFAVPSPRHFLRAYADAAGASTGITGANESAFQL